MHVMKLLELLEFVDLEGNTDDFLPCSQALRKRYMGKSQIIFQKIQ